MELRLDKVTKRYGDGVALDAIDLTFPSGRTTALLGPSGCGKSTVLRLLVALVAPEEGAVLVDGRPLPDHDIQGLRRRIGYVIQDGGLFPHLTAAGNATLMARHLGWDKARDRPPPRRARGADPVPEGGSGAVPDGALRAARPSASRIMRALFLDPEVLLMDEPLGALDPLVRAELRDDLRGIFRSFGKTVVS